MGGESSGLLLGGSCCRCVLRCFIAAFCGGSRLVAVVVNSGGGDNGRGGGAVDGDRRVLVVVGGEEGVFVVGGVARGGERVGGRGGSLARVIADEAEANVYVTVAGNDDSSRGRGRRGGRGGGGGGGGSERKGVERRHKQFAASANGGDAGVKTEEGQSGDSCGHLRGVYGTSGGQGRGLAAVSIGIAVVDGAALLLLHHPAGGGEVEEGRREEEKQNAKIEGGLSRLPLLLLGLLMVTGGKVDCHRRHCGVMLTRNVAGTGHIG